MLYSTIYIQFFQTMRKLEKTAEKATVYDFDAEGISFVTHSSLMTQERGTNIIQRDYRNLKKKLSC